MDQVTINSDLYETVYQEVKNYGKAEYNHCPGIRLYPHYKDYLKGKIIDLGSGTGETVKFFRTLNHEAIGYDWIKPQNEYCEQQDITVKLNLKFFDIATSFDVIEHLTNFQVKKLFINMTDCKFQIFTIANTPSIVKLENGDEIDLHINKKSFDKWRGILVDYFDILQEISIRDYQNLYICQQKKSTKEYFEYIINLLRKNNYTVEKNNE